MLEFLDYETLRLIWWALLGSLIIIFAITDGFDLGVAMLLPLVAIRNHERRILLNSIGPFWEGNQVWFIISIGVVFSAWPYVYAVSLSGLYLGVMLVAFSLMMRPIGFHFRSKIEKKYWRTLCDCVISISAFVTTFILGAIVGCIIQGLPFTFNEFMMIENHIRVHAVFNSFSALCGVLAVFMFATHGACYLTMKTEGKILLRSSRILSFSPFLVMTVFAIGALFLDFLSCYKITAFAGPLADSNPMSKSVIKGLGCLNDNYETYGWMKIAPISVFVCQIIIPLLIIIKHFKKAFFLSSVSIIGIISTVGLSLFPFILPSSIDPKASLTIWDASSSEKTLLILLAVTIVCLPLIIFCTSFAYKVMRGGVNRASVNDNLNSY